MANPARNFRNKAQETWPGAAVWARGRNWIVHQHPSDPRKKMLDISIAPIHIQNTETEIDTDWVLAAPGDSPFQRKMVLADYHAYFGNGNLQLDAAFPFRYVDPESGDFLNWQLNPNLQWTNDLNSVANAGGNRQAVAAQITADTLFFPGAYGPGIDLYVESQTARLQKRLLIDTLARIGAPSQAMIDGGNPVLVLSYQIQRSAGVTIWVDGVQWAEGNGQANARASANHLEFRSSDGTTLWYVSPAYCWDQSGNQVTGPVRIRRSGASYIIELRIPWSWLQTAVFPVIIDPTIDVAVNTGNDDADESSGGLMTLTRNILLNVDGSGEWNAWKFRGVTISAGSTIDVSYMIVRMNGASLDEPDVTFDAHDTASPADFSTTTSDISGRTGTTATVNWSNTNAGTADVNTSSFNTILQELVDSHAPYSNGTMVIRMKSRANDATRDTSIESYETSTTTCGRLHVEFTEAGNDPPTIALNTADGTNFNNDTTPTVEFTGSDVDGDPLTYEIRISNNQDSWTGGNVVKESITAGSGTTVHPNPLATGTTWEGKIPVDDRVGQVFRGRGGKLKQIEWYFGAHETQPQTVNGQYVCRLYYADGYPVGTVPPAWAASTAYSVGNEVRPTSVANADVHFVYRCTTAGTSGTTEPTWPLVPENTVNDGSAVWETIRCAGPINPADPEDTPTSGWIAQSTVYNYNPGGADAQAWRVTAFTGDQQIILERDTLYCAILDWWPNDRVSTNALTVQTAGTANATYAYGNVYLDATQPNNNGPRITDDAWFKVTEEYILLEKASDTHTGFVNTVNGGDTDPFNAGEKISYTVQAGEALTDGEYVWSARVSDPAGTGNWSSWAATRSFNILSVAEIYPSGIASAEAFGTATLTTGAVSVAPSGIASAEAFGTATVAEGGEEQTVQPTGIVSSEAFGTATLTTGSVSVVPSGIASAEAHGTANITTGVVSVSPSGIGSAEAFGTAVISRGAVSVLPSGISSSEAFGTSTLTTGSVAVSPSGIPSAESFGTQVLTTGAVSVSPSGISSSEVFGTAVILRGAVTVSPSGIASAEAFGTVAVSRGTVFVSPSGIASVEAFGTAAITTGPVTVLPSGIASAEAFGTSIVSSGGTNIYPPGTASAEAFGSPSVTTGSVSVFPTGISSAEAFGTSVVSSGGANVYPSGIASAEAFGTARISLSVTPAGIVSAEGFGSVLVSAGAVAVAPSGISSSEAFGTPVVSSGGTIISVPSIGSAETFGTAQITTGPVVLSPSGIVSLEAFGTAIVSAGGAQIIPSGIASAEAFGTAEIDTGAVTVLPGGIISAEAFGTATISSGAAYVQPTGIASAEFFGNHIVSAGELYVVPAGIPSAEAFGLTEITTGPVTIIGAGISTSEAFGEPSISLYLLPGGISTSEAFGTAEVAVGAVSVVPTGIASSEAFGATTLSTGAVTLQPSGIPSAESVSSPFVAPGVYVVAPSNIASAEAFGLPVLSVGETTVAVFGITSAEAFGTAVVSAGIVDTFYGSVSLVMVVRGVVSITTTISAEVDS